MRVGILVIGFYGEGRRDYGFLMPLIERAVSEIVPEADVLTISLEHLNISGLSQSERLLKIAGETKGYDLVIFHLDADAPTADKAYSERFLPGYRKLLEGDEDLNKNIIPVIPVRTTEAWMLVDFDAFCKVVGTKLGRSELGFPQKPHQVEAIGDPKLTFESAVSRARPGRRKRIPLDDVYGPLAARIDLELLGKVPSYSDFISRLKRKLEELSFIDREDR